MQTYDFMIMQCLTINKAWFTNVNKLCLTAAKFSISHLGMVAYDRTGCENDTINSLVIIQNTDMVKMYHNNSDSVVLCRAC